MYFKVLCLASSLLTIKALGRRFGWAVRNFSAKGFKKIIRLS